jgi:hypothetical protein
VVRLCIFVFVVMVAVTLVWKREGTVFRRWAERNSGGSEDWVVADLSGQNQTEAMDSNRTGY